MMLISILISFPLEYYKEFVAKKITFQPGIEFGTSRLSGASVLIISTIEACDDTLRNKRR